MYSQVNYFSPKTEGIYFVLLSKIFPHENNFFLLLQAKKWHERQLDMALSTRDRIGEGRACSNLGIVYQLLGEHDAALKLHQAHLNITRALQDRAGMGRAYGNIGNAYSAMGFYEQVNLIFVIYIGMIFHAVDYIFSCFPYSGYQIP